MQADLSTKLDQFAADTVGTYQKTALVVLIVLVILVLWLWSRVPGAPSVAEGAQGGPVGSYISNLRFDVGNDTVGLGSASATGDFNPYRERMSDPAPAVQRYGGDDIHGILSSDLAAQIAKGTGPGSPAYTVLHSPAFDCNKRNPAGDDAWAWQVGQSKVDSEGMTVRSLEGYKNAAEALNVPDDVALRSKLY